VPKRRRNEDGSLVVPLSPKQQAALARGRAALVAKASTPADKGEPPAASSGRKVEVVKLSKDSGSRTKASGSKRTKASSPSRARKPVAAPAAEPAKERTDRGLGERFVDWLSST